MYQCYEWLKINKKMLLTCLSLYCGSIYFSKSANSTRIEGIIVEELLRPPENCELFIV